MSCKRRTRLASLLWMLILLAGTQEACSDHRFRVRTPPGQQVDVFLQASVPLVDVLWVVDNSKSMEEEQQALAENFSYFYQHLDSTGADFHIGVISTDIYNPAHQGRLLGTIPIISRATPSANEVFDHNINVGVEGKGDEQGIRAALLALDEPLISTENAGFLREDAHLFVIFVSDEDDRSFGEVTFFVRSFETIKDYGNDAMVNVSAVVGDVPEVPAACREAKNAEPGERYADLAVRTGGLVLSICDDDFAFNLEQLGFSAAGLRRLFQLTRRAVPQSIEVWVKTPCSADPPMEGLCETYFNDCGSTSSDLFGQTCVLRQSLPDGWAYEEDTKSIRFFGAAVPPFGSVIEIGYIPEEDL